jgi:hypothetical protein
LALQGRESAKTARRGDRALQTKRFGGGLRDGHRVDRQGRIQSGFVVSLGNGTDRLQRDYHYRTRQAEREAVHSRDADDGDYMAVSRASRPWFPARWGEFPNTRVLILAVLAASPELA